MKKFLALALTLTLALALSISAFAEPAELVLGSKTGVASFKDTVNGDTTVVVSATVGDILNRYAVDLIYTPLSVSVAGSTLTWDVENLEYVSSGTVVPANTEGTVTFHNRSDLPVYVSYAVTDVDNNDYLAITVDQPASKQPIAKATPKVGATAGTPGELVYTITVDAVDADDTTNAAAEWALAAEYYAAWFNKKGGDSTPIATITFTISMTNS